MKLFIPPSNTVVRIEIIERGNISKTITVDERDSLVVSNNIKEMLNADFQVNLNPLSPPRKISIQIYDCVGGKKGKFNTFTVYGVSVEEVYLTIMGNLKS